MTKWEYCTITQSMSPKGEIISPITVTKHGVTETHEEMSVEQVMAKLGDEGWELVSHSPVFVGWGGQGYEKVTDNYFFKRPAD